MAFMEITQDITSIKQQYRELFDTAHKQIRELFQTLQGHFSCSQCTTPPQNIETRFHEGCGYIEWQKSVIIALEKELGKKIYESLQDIDAQKETLGSCQSCAICCDLSSSEFSYDELLAKAAQGDNYAQQFTSVFLPYETHETAKAKYPVIVDEIVAQTDGQVHFYHCPHLTPERKCGIYTDPRRPKICASYPETPLTLMAKGCGYQPWKQTMLPTTLLAHATLELCTYYSQKLWAIVTQYKA